MKRECSRVISILSFITILTSIIATGSDASSPDFTPLDLCIVMDRSLSMDYPMGDSTKLNGAKNAAIDVVNALLPQDRVAVITFFGDASTEIDLTSDFNLVRDRIRQITSKPSTSFGAGLKEALNQFDSQETNDHIKAIIFMSDGKHNTPPDPFEYIEECKRRGIPIFTVGFATNESDIDVDNLTMMSESTGGEYTFASDLFKIENAFLRLGHEASNWDKIAEYMGKVNPGETVVAGTFNVAAYMGALRVTLNWPGSNMDMKLFDPSGRELDINSPNVIYSGDTKPEYLIIKDPQPGTWIAMIYGKTLAYPEEYYLFAGEYKAPSDQAISNVPVEKWSTTFSSKSVCDWSWSLDQTADQGYIIAGNVKKQGYNDCDLWLIKIDSKGKAVWEKTFGGYDNDSACSVKQTLDGGYIIAGWNSSDLSNAACNEICWAQSNFDFNYPENSNGWLIKTDSLGNIIWNRIFSGLCAEVGKSVLQTKDGGYVVVMDVVDGKNIDARLIKVDPNGITEWEKVFAKAAREQITSIQQTRDNGYILAGALTPDENGSIFATSFAWLVKTNSRGDVEWERTFGFGGDGEDWASSVQETKDGGYIIAGYTYPYPYEVNGIVIDRRYGSLRKTDSLGNIEWEKTFGDLGYGTLNSAQEAFNGGYILTGGGEQVSLLKVDSIGNVEWNKSYGYGPSMQNFAQPTNDGGYILMGIPYHRYGYGNEGSLVIIKTNSEGDTIIFV